MKTPVPTGDYTGANWVSRPPARGRSPVRERRSVAGSERIGHPRLSSEAAGFRGVPLPHPFIQEGYRRAPPRGPVAEAGFGGEGVYWGGCPCSGGACRAEEIVRPGRVDPGRRRREVLVAEEADDG